MNNSRDGVDGADVSASLDTLLKLRERNAALDLRVSAVVRVIVYYPATQKADLRIECLPVRFVGDEEVPDPPILLPQVPVQWPRTAAGYITFPLVPGDTGRVVFTDRNLAQWLVTGNEGNAIDPLNGRAHSLGDAVFEPGLHTDTDPIVPPTSLLATVVEGPLVQLGVGATQFVALAALVEAQLNTLKAAIAAAPVTPLDGGAGFKAALVAALAAWPTTTAATKVQAI
jgi:hypothetical protein